MELYKYFPIASDRMGVLWTLSSIEGACIIEFGPAGTTHYAIEGIGSLNGDDLAKVYSTHISDEDIAFGSVERIKNSIMELDTNIKPKYMFVMGSSISSIIGADIKSVCVELQDSINAKLIPIDIAGTKEDYNRGIEQALLIIGKNIIKDEKRDNNLYNVIGCNVDTYNFSSDVTEIERIIGGVFDKKLNTIFTANTSIPKLEESSKASLNIVLRKEGVKLAKYMEKKFNIPYVYRKPIGVKSTLELIKEIEDKTDYKRNEDFVSKEVSNVEKHLASLRFKLMAFNNRDVAIIGDEDTVISMKRYIEELGLRVVRTEILHGSSIDSSDGIIVRGSEFDRECYLKDNELLMLMGDGVSLDMKHKSYSDVQISNPNLRSVTIYQYTPFVGFRGALYILEKIFNIKKY